MVDTRPVDSGTLSWYIDWLAERCPDWTDEQRLEAATGFAQSQLPPQQPPEDDDPEATNLLTDHEIRAADRKARRYLTGKELMEILR